MTIEQGNLYWVRLSGQESIGNDVTHPHVVIQVDLLNQSRIPTTVVRALSTNLGKVQMAGNVLLSEGEGNLPKQSVVVVSQLSVVEKTSLTESIGELGPERIEEILAGISFQTKLVSGRDRQ